MPAIELKNVRSFSSEDKKFPAENLLKGDGFKKWKSGTSGEKQVSVIIEFDKPSQIHSIDIGNEGSAFVEVLVARSEEKTENFHVLLVASSFMNPQESKSSSNLNRVRMFDKEKLTKSLLGQKWDLVKIVCTQPFNKSTQYGLSFIKFHAPGNGSESESKSSVTSPLGMFKMKEKPKEEVKVGSAFAAYKKHAPDVGNSSASASARSVSKFADEVLAREAAAVRAKIGESPRESKTPKRKFENDGGNSGTPKRSRDTPSPRNTPKFDKKREERRSSPSRERRARSPSPDRRRKRSPSPKRKRSPTPEKRGRKSPISRPFSKLMKNVVFAMSGYQNPERAEIRDKACEMGANYKPDWGRGCTHLICAFVNTPKYNSVKGKGRIVDADWIHRCYKEKKLLPWRRYRVGKARTPANSSDEECVAEEIRPKVEKEVKREVKRDSSPEIFKPSTSKDHAEKTSKSEEKPSTSGVKKNAIAYEDSDDSIYDRDTDVKEMDTDEEVERIKNATKSPAKKGSPVKTNKKPNLPDFFDKLTFLLYGNFTPGERKILKRLILAYKGELVDYMGDDVTHVVTNSKWDSNFDKALNENEDLKFVKMQWIFECDKAQKTVGLDKFCVECD